VEESCFVQGLLRRSGEDVAGIIDQSNFPAAGIKLLKHALLRVPAIAPHLGRKLPEVASVVLMQKRCKENPNIVLLCC
jgi:hypothetical protein